MVISRCFFPKNQHALCPCGCCAHVLWTNVDEDSIVICFSFQLLGDMLLDRSNAAVMMRYVSSKDNLMILMNLLRVSVPHITSGQIELTIYMSSTFEVFYPSSDSLYHCCHPFSTFSVLFCQDSSKNIQIEAFHVFKVCVYNSLNFILPTKVYLNSFGYCALCITAVCCK